MNAEKEYARLCVLWDALSKEIDKADRLTREHVYNTIHADAETSYDDAFYADKSADPIHEFQASSWSYRNCSWCSHPRESKAHHK